jgi:hypothetical protein
LFGTLSVAGNGVLLLSTADPSWVRRFGPSPSALEALVFLSPALPIVGIVVALKGVEERLIRRALFTNALRIAAIFLPVALIVFAIGSWASNCSLPAKPEIAQGKYVLDYHGELTPISEAQFWSYMACARKTSAFVSFAFGLAATIFLTLLARLRFGVRRR